MGSGDRPWMSDLSLFPLDNLGHLLCAYDATGDCECITLPTRLADHDAQVRAEERERIALAMGGLGFHQTGCRYPDDACACELGLFDVRKIASRIARATGATP